MKDNKLYSYICEKCEKRSIPIEELHKKCKFSRSSNYRYMCGLIPKSKLYSVEEKFSEVLKLNALEKKKLHELIYLQSLTDIDINNMELIDSYVFDKQVIPKEKDLDFMYYNKNDIFSRAKSDILNIIFEESDDENCSMDIKIINSLDDDSLEFITKLIDIIKNLKNLSKVHIEHLISFPEDSYENSLNILFKIIPLFKFDKYDAYYTKKKANNFLLNNPIIISKTYSNSNKKQYFLITFLENDYPQCFSYDDEIHYKFLMRCYESCKHNYKSSIITARDIDALSETLISMEMNNNYYLIKKNNCFNQIPIDTYKKTVSRYNNKELCNLLKIIFNVDIQEFEIKMSLDNLWTLLKKRIDLSYKNKHTNVFSKQGLIELCKTGRTSDLFKEMLPFTKDEVKEILEYIRDRNLNPNDSYKLYITNDAILKDGSDIVISEDYAILITFVPSNDFKNVCQNILIKNSSLAKMFVNYIESYIPAKCLSDKETTFFINNLISTYLTE